MARIPICGVVVLLFVLAGCGGDDSPSSGGDRPNPECATDADCPAERPRCDDGVCVVCIEGEDCEKPGCSSDAECPDDQPVCGEDGACGGCAADADCEGRALGVCNPATGACVACMDDEDCPDGATCAANQCQQTAGCTETTQCNEGELCVFPDGDATFGTCAPICDPYSEGGCTEGRICAFVGMTQELVPLGACLQPNGGAGEQEACDPEICEVGFLCVTYRPGDERCTSICDLAVGDAACGTGFECTEIGLTSPPDAKIGICTPIPVPCRNDDDCEPDQACTLTEDENEQLIQVCAPRSGAKGAGERCTDSAECASGICLNGQQVCYGGCLTNDDCAAGSACTDVNVGTSAVTACMPTCTDDVSCGPQLTCIAVPTRDRQSLALVCSAADGSQPAGARCLLGSDCRSGLCRDGYCYGVCDGDEDCGGDTLCTETAYRLSLGRDGTSNTSDDVWASYMTCVGRPCATSGNCSAGWACSIVPEPADRTASLASTRCVGEDGTEPGGAACTSNLQCASGLCLDPRLSPEDCDDTLDNDDDGLVDCADPDCDAACNTEFECRNGLDDDGDGAIDCADGDCNFVCTFELSCTDGLDDEGDGLADCEDPDCDFACGLLEFRCTDRLDDDGDGLVDCADPDCSGATACRENFPSSNCGDGSDNDGDGWTDCQDPDCRTTSACSGILHEGFGPSAECSDGSDNDGDGLVDCGDPGCSLVAPCTEASCPAGDCCVDGADNDGDGLRDCLDPDCAIQSVCHEAGRCDDGVDDDGDRLVDCWDPDCAFDPACSEVDCATGDCCADGLDNDGDGGVDCVDADCFFTAACEEDFCGTGNCCGDGQDNDRDGVVDCADSDCAFSSFCREVSCSDGADNEGDGLADCDDRDCYGSSVCTQRICFAACEVEADCPPGYSCLPEAGWITLDFQRDDQGYAAGCVPAP